MKLFICIMMPWHRLIKKMIVFHKRCGYNVILNWMILNNDLMIDDNNKNLIDEYSDYIWDILVQLWTRKIIIIAIIIAMLL